MAQLKRFGNVKANSLLESVLALSIISVCLYIAVMVYSAVFSPKTSIRFYSSQNKINEVFFLMQINQDSLNEKYEGKEWEFEESANGRLKTVAVKYKDSTQSYPVKNFYIINEKAK
ncbi:hypothetical protein D3C87_419990 [compost metagenome]